MTPEQEAEINGLLGFLQRDAVAHGNTAARRERARRVWDSLTALIKERDDLRVQVLKHLELVKGEDE